MNSKGHRQIIQESSACVRVCLCVHVCVQDVCRPSHVFAVDYRMGTTFWLRFFHQPANLSEERLSHKEDKGFLLRIHKNKKIPQLKSIGANVSPLESVFSSVGTFLISPHTGLSGLCHQVMIFAVPYPIAISVDFPKSRTLGQEEPWGKSDFWTWIFRSLSGQVLLHPLYKAHKLPFSSHLCYTQSIKLVGGYPAALVRFLSCCDWIPAGNQLRQEGFISVCGTEVSDHGGKVSRGQSSSHHGGQEAEQVEQIADLIQPSGAHLWSATPSAGLVSWNFCDFTEQHHHLVSNSCTWSCGGHVTFMSYYHCHCLLWGLGK